MRYARIKKSTNQVINLEVHEEHPKETGHHYYVPSEEANPNDYYNPDTESFSAPELPDNEQLALAKIRAQAELNRTDRYILDDSELDEASKVKIRFYRQQLKDIFKAKSIEQFDEPEIPKLTKIKRPLHLKEMKNE